MKNKNITLFIGSLTGGGAERVTCNLANYLQRIGNNVTILTMSDVEDTYSIDNDVRREYLLRKNERKNKIFDFIRRYNRLKKYMKTKNCDAYIVMLPITTIMMLFLRRKTTAKIIISERVDPASYSKIKKILLKMLSKRADGYVFQTEDAQNWYNIKNKKTIVIPNAINEEFLNIKFDNIRRKNRIVSVGRLNSQKNFKLLISAFSKISKEFSDYTLTIYGEGKQREQLQMLINNLDLTDKVLLPGYSKNIKEDIIDASLFVMSSDFEGMPNALIEAMALGLPCISTDCPCGGPRYLIDNNKNGILIKVNDEDELVDKINYILSNKEIAVNMGNNARKIVDRLNPQKIYKDWELYISSVIE